MSAPDPVQARIDHAAAMGRQMMRVFCQVDLDGAADPVAAIDEAIDRFDPTPTPTARSILMCGACFGEAVRARLGGAWRDDGDSGLRLEGCGGSAGAFFPMARAAARFTGPEAMRLVDVLAALTDAIASGAACFPDDAASPANHCEADAEDRLRARIEKAEAWLAAQPPPEAEDEDE